MSSSQNRIDELPIDVVKGSRPLTFKWRQTVSTPTGMKVIEHRGSLPASVEDSVLLTIDMVKVLLRENDTLMERIAAQSELLSKKAEKVPQNKEVKK